MILMFTDERNEKNRRATPNKLKKQKQNAGSTVKSLDPAVRSRLR